MTLLLDDRPIVVHPRLVRRVGLLEAAILQQLHYWAARATRFHEGLPWVYKTYGDWGQEIGVSSKAVRGALDRLRKEGIVIAIENPTDPRDRTLWWRIDQAALHDEMPANAPTAPEGSPTAPEGTPAAPEGSSRARVPSPPTEAQGKDEVVAEMTTETARERADSLALVTIADRDTVEVRPFTHRGKTVPASVRRAAVEALATFSEAVGRSVRAQDATDGASPEVKQIAGAMLARPDATLEEWLAAIRATVDRPPEWIDGPLQIGHVFGERAAAHALALGRGEAPVVNGNTRKRETDTIMAAARAAAEAEGLR